MSADVVTRIHRLSSAPSYNDAEDDEEEKEDDDYNLAVDDAKIAGVNNDDDTIDDDDDDDSDDDDALVALDDGNNAELAMDLELTMAPEPNFDATDPDTDATDEIDNARPGADKTTWADRRNAEAHDAIDDKDNADIIDMDANIANAEGSGV